MDKNCISEIILAGRNLGMQCYNAYMHGVYSAAFKMISEIPHGSVENGMLVQHPVLVFGLWASYKMGLDRVGSKIQKFAEKTIKKANEGLEGKL